MTTTMARFPFQKSLESFDFKFQPSIEPKVVRERPPAASSRMRTMCCCSGIRASGKTHLAVALGLRACALGFRTTFVTALGLIASLTRAHTENRLEEKLKLMVQPKLLIIDEIGYLPWRGWGPTCFSNSSRDGMSGARS